MPLHEIMKLSRDAAKRAREAIAAAKAEGGPGWGKRGLAAAAGPLAEIGEHSRAVQRFRKIEEGLNDKEHRLHRVRLDSTRPPDVKRRQVAELETGIEDLKTARRDCEAEVRTTLLPALTDTTETQEPQGKSTALSVSLPEVPRVKPTPPVGLPALPQMKPEAPAEDRTPAQHGFQSPGVSALDSDTRQAIADMDDAGLVDLAEKALREKRRAVADTDDAGLIDPAERAQREKRRAVAGTDDAGLASLADSRLDIDDIAALEPRTYDEYLRNARAIAEGAGMKGDELSGLESMLSSDEDGLPDDISGSDEISSRARENYREFVQKALARRGTPQDFPRATGGAIDMSLVQPGFVYKAGDGVLFMVHPDRKKFVEARKRRTPDTGGRLYEPVAGGESVSARDMRYRAKGRGTEVTHGIPTSAQGKVNVGDLDRRVIYEVEDGTTFRWDGEEFREVYWDEKTGVWLPRSDPARDFGNAGISNLSEEAGYDRDAVAIGRETGFRFTAEAARIHTLAVDMQGVRKRLRNRRLNGLSESSPEITALKKRLTDGMSRLRGMRAELAAKARPETLSAKEMAGRMDDPARLENAANSGVQGFGKVIASIPIFFAVSHSRRIMKLNEFWDQIDAGKHPREMNFPKGINPMGGLSNSILRVPRRSASGCETNYATPIPALPIYLN